MPRPDKLEVSLDDAIACGFVLGLGPARTLEIWRELGGKIREQDFYAAWNEMRGLLDDLRSAMRAEQAQNNNV